jgi:hypothetical protein
VTTETTDIARRLRAAEAERDRLIDLLVQDSFIAGPDRYHVRRPAGMYSRGYATKAEAIASVRRAYGLDEA